jgi:hypothetical protein
MLHPNPEMELAVIPVPGFKECQTLEDESLWSGCTQQHSAHDARIGPGNLEEMEQLSPAQPYRNQNALLQAAGRTRHGTRL